MELQPPRLAHLSKAASLGLVLAIYIVTLAVAVGFVELTDWQSLLLIGAAADVVCTVVIWLFSTALRNSSMYDAYWSVAPVPLAFYWWLSSQSEGNETRAMVVTLLVTIWGIRLTYNWARGWTGMKHEDWRYTDYRRRTGKLYPLVDLFGIHMFPTVQVFLGMLPVWAACARPGAPFGALDVVAAIITAVAILIEGVADNQLRDFMKRRKPGEIMNEGLWKHSRHPNYFGQIMLWWGLYGFALAADPAAYWWTGIGALAINIMFLVVSVPLIDTRSIERRPGFAEHCEKTRMFIPLPR